MRDNQKYKNKRAKKSFRLLDHNGNPLKNQRVEISQTKHEFLFS